MAPTSVAVALESLLTALSSRRVIGQSTRTITGLAHDSRTVTPGTLFVAIRGLQHDGHQFAAEAVERGAVAVVCESAEALPPEVLARATVIEVPEDRKALADLSCAFYGHPSEELILIGVTGTNGKTTTTTMIASVFEAAGIPAATVGTLGIRRGEEVTELARTTPEASDLQRGLRRLVDQGVRAVAMEVSSHALALHRVRGCLFDAACFTNLTTDHLDFHGDFENYFAAKAMLFTDHAQASARKKPFAAILNADDPAGLRLLDLCPSPALTYGVTESANLTAQQVEITRSGASYLARTGDLDLPVHLQVTGRFNVYNSLAAVGVGVLQGVAPESLRAGLEALERLDGRLEMIEEGQPFAVAVDYAHTPDGLRSVLETVREIADGRIITVFGCGGDRDRTKRPQMGALAETLSDLCVITSDNPRGEDPEAILEDILEGITDRSRCETLVDRRAAIERALELAQPGDFVLVAGKGHETRQVFADRALHFDDREVVREALGGARLA